MNYKTIMKRILPNVLVRNYQEFKMVDFRLKTLEGQSKSKWLLERISERYEQLEEFRLHEFKVFSQTGEDGIIEYIFRKIGVTKKNFVEIGIEDGKECNTANLTFNFGWSGLLIEGNKKYAKQAEKYYRNRHVKVVYGFVTKNNINNLLKDNGATGKIDLLSIDIDGNDYWIWDAIEVIDPRVVIVEYNPSFLDESVTVKYSPNFRRFSAHKSGFYYGASLAALTKLAESKGYILVGSNSLGFNAFFIKKKDAKRIFKPMSSEEILNNLPNKKILLRNFSKIKNMEFVKV